MPLMKDKETGHYWKNIGDNLTPNIEEAANYSYGQAQALLRLYGDTTVYLVSNPAVAGQWIEHEYIPEPRSMPILTQQMKDKNLVWVSLGDVWLAADKQSLTMASMLVLNGTTPHTKVGKQKPAPVEPINFDFPDEGPNVA